MNLTIYFMVILYVYIRSVSTLTCYTCMESTNINACERRQRAEDCSSDTSAVCMALSFNTRKDKSLSNRYVKKCMKKSVCEGYCELAGISDVMEKCQTTCCESNLCNERIFQNKSKRSSMTEGLHSSHGKMKSNKLFIIGNLLLLMIFLVNLNDVF